MKDAYRERYSVCLSVIRSLLVVYRVFLTSALSVVYLCGRCRSRCQCSSGARPQSGSSTRTRPRGASSATAPRAHCAPPRAPPPSCTAHTMPAGTLTCIHGYRKTRARSVKGVEYPSLEMGQK